MAQTSTKTVTFSSIVGAKEFRKGVEDYLNGITPDFDKPRGKHTWNYERGRQYAAACAGEGRKPYPNRNGLQVNRAAIRDFVNFYGDGIL